MTEDYDEQQEQRPAQEQKQPGVEGEMEPRPAVVPTHYRAENVLPE